MDGCGESKVMVRSGASLPCMVSKPALDTQEIGGEVNSAILSILGLAQGFIMRGDQSAM